MAEEVLAEIQLARGKVDGVIEFFRLGEKNESLHQDDQVLRKQHHFLFLADSKLLALLAFEIFDDFLLEVVGDHVLDFGLGLFPPEIVAINLPVDVEGQVAELLKELQLVSAAFVEASNRGTEDSLKELADEGVFLPLLGVEPIQQFRLARLALHHSGRSLLNRRVVLEVNLIDEHLQKLLAILLVVVVENSPGELLFQLVDQFFHGPALRLFLGQVVKNMSEFSRN